MRDRGENGGPVADERRDPEQVDMAAGKLERCLEQVAELRRQVQMREEEYRIMAQHVARLSRYELASLLMGTLAYDINDLLTIIKGYSEMMHDRMGDVVIKAEVAEVIKASDRAAGIVKKLLELQLSAAHDQVKGARG